jgi:hypothetical protein
MRKRVLPFLALVGLLFNAGCLIDGKVDDKGGAVLKIVYRLAPKTKLEPARKMMESSFVTVKSAEVDKDNRATIDFEIKDVTKINTAPFFKQVLVKLTDGKEKGTKDFRATHTIDKPLGLPERMREYYGNEFRLTLAFPGEIVKSNATETKGDTATWKMTLDEFLKAKESVFEATYKAK